jgi:peroxiredoxin
MKSSRSYLIAAGVFFSGVLLALPLLPLAQETTTPILKGTVYPPNTQKFTITGNVKGLAENSAVFVTDVSNPGDTLAETIAKGGQFVLSGHVAEPNLFEVNFGDAKKKAPLFMGNDKMSMVGSVADIKGLKTTGSSSNDDFVEFQGMFNPYFARINSVIGLANSPEGAKSKDSLFRVYKKLADTVQTALDQYIEKKHSSFVAPFVLVVLNQISEDATVAQERRLHSLAPEVQKSYYAQYLQKQIDETKIGAIGTAAIDFVQNDTAGHAVSLSSFKGKYVLVDFWASWCGPCRMENPNVVSTYKKFKSKNFTVLGVSLDKSKEPWIKAIKDDGLAWTQVSDLKYWYNDAATKYHIQSIPQNLLIDPSGKIVGRNLRGPDLQSKLCELLGCE